VFTKFRHWNLPGCSTQPKITETLIRHISRQGSDFSSKILLVQFVVDKWMLQFSGNFTFLLSVVISINSTSKDYPFSIRSIKFFCTSNKLTIARMLQHTRFCYTEIDCCIIPVASYFLPLMSYTSGCLPADHFFKFQIFYRYFR